jgi:hypothetical protein
MTPQQKESGMINSQRITVSRGNPAAAARERLLQDKAMRRNRDDAVFTMLDPALLAWQTTTPPVKSTRPAAGGLTPVQQRQQALLVARSFKEHYLSGISYREDCGTTIAIVRPIQRKKGNVPHRISVDPAGNVSVTRLKPSPAAPSPRIMRWLLLAGGAIGPLLTLLLVAVS